jgi:hypothetical protein
MISNKVDTASLVISEARNLLAKNMQDPLIYEVLIERSFEAKMNDAARDLIKKAIELYPEMKERFSRFGAA